MTTATAERLANGKKPCGTAAAYRRHLRNGQVPCNPCTNAAAALSIVRKETSALFRDLLDLIAAECRRDGLLP